MEFHNFLKYIPKIAKEKLPAANAHLKMAPVERIEMLKELKFRGRKVQFSSGTVVYLRFLFVKIQTVK